MSFLPLLAFPCFSALARFCLCLCSLLPLPLLDFAFCLCSLSMFKACLSAFTRSIHSQRPIRSFREPVITETNHHQYKLQHQIVINRTQLECKTKTVFYYNYCTRLKFTTAAVFWESICLGRHSTSHSPPSVSHSPPSSKPCFGHQEILLPVLTVLAHSVSPMMGYSKFSVS